MTIRSTLIPNQIVIRDGQAFDGFHIQIADDAEFGGTYEFDMSYDWQSAHAHIFAGAVSPMGES